MAENQGAGVSPSANSTSDSRIFAALSYLSLLSIIFYVLKKDDSYVQFHAKQGMVLFGLQLLGMLIIFTGPIAMLVELVAFVMMVIGAVKAYGGEKYRMPVVADLADKINF